VFTHVEIERNDRLILQHDPFRLLEESAALRRIDLGRGAAQQVIVGGVPVVSEVDAEIALEILGERVGVIVVADPAGAEHLHVAAVDVLHQ